jgi:hypothetical protein
LWDADAFSPKGAYCRECCAAKARIRRADPEIRPLLERNGRERYQRKKAFHKKLTHRWRAGNPEKIRAIWAVGNAVRDYKLERKPCESCGTKVNVRARHDDYSQRLKVNWRCGRCQNEIKRAKAAAAWIDQAPASPS